MNITFGTDGWRGLIDKEINNNTIQYAAQAFADYLNFYHRSTTSIGYDGRKYSKEFARVFAEVLSGNNIKVFLSKKIIPTPALSFSVKNLSLDAGVMITASHNPAEYNGVKFKANYGGPFLTEETLKVEKLIGRSSVKSNAENIELVDFIPEYYNQLKSKVDFSLIRNADLKILVDSMGGAGRRYLEDLLKQFDISAETIFATAENDFYGRNAEPIEKNLSPLKDKLVKDKKWSLGIATDGDADRLGVLLNNGKWLSAQVTILLLADYLVNQKNYSGDIVKTSSVSDKLREYFESNNRNVLDVQVGFKYICEEMIKREVAFGCEESGGYGYKDHIPERDGILSALLMVEMLAKSGYKKLSDYVTEKQNEFGVIYYDRIDHKYGKPDRIDRLPQIFADPPKEIARYKLKNIEKYFSSRGIINGLKFYLKGNPRWLLLRASETEPLVRIYAEGESSAEVNEILEFGFKLIEKSN